MRVVFAFLLISGVNFGCGVHTSSNHSQTKTGDRFQGQKPTDDRGRLEEAITNNDLAGVIAILDRGFPLDSLLANGKTALIDATVKSKYRIMVELLARKADKGARGAEGKTALEHAREAAGVDENGDPVINRAVVLLDDEAQLSQRQLLMKFAGRGSNESLQRLLQDVGVDPNFVDEATGETPLTKAILSNKLLSVDLLAHWTDCPYGPDEQATCLKLTPTNISFPRRDGATPLAVARSMKDPNPEIIAILVQLNAEEGTR